MFLVAAAALAALPATAAAQRWCDDTAATIGATAEWTNKVELADVDGDGWLDVVLANGRGYSSPGAAERSRVFRNRGAWTGAAPYFEEITAQIFGGATGHARVIKVRDGDGDGDDDVFVGNTYGDASRLYRRDAGGWTDVTVEALPAAPVVRVGDADLGDVDGDGDLDLALADWGADLDAGARPRLWRNDGGGVFTDATEALLPDVAVAWSWELDLVDVDVDLDLDLLIASKLGARRPDLVDGQGEVAFPDLVYRATEALPVDTQAPRLGALGDLGGAARTVRIRVHDGKTPAGRLDLAAVVVAYRGDAEGECGTAPRGAGPGTLLLAGLVALVVRRRRR